MTIDHLNLKIVSICWQIASFKICISEVQDFVNFDFYPWGIQVKKSLLCDDNVYRATALILVEIVPS